MNSIAQKQNEPENINLLRAQRRYYSRAKRYQGGLYIASIVLAVGSSMVPASNTKLQAYMPILALAFLLFDILLVSPFIKRYKECAAKCQELFDTKVLTLPHNGLISGPPIAPSVIYEVTSDEITAADKKKFEDWYVGDFTDLPLAAARIMCQRMNVTYDKTVRSTYMWTLIIALVIIAFILLAVGVCRELTLNELVFTWAAPLTPLVTLVVREAKSHWDALGPLHMLDSEIASLLKDAMRSPADESLTSRARQVQDAIYQRRESNPLVLDAWYNKVREKNEKIARLTVEHTVSEFKDDKQ